METSNIAQLTSWNPHCNGSWGCVGCGSLCVSVLGYVDVKCEGVCKMCVGCVIGYVEVECENMCKT